MARLVAKINGVDFADLELEEGCEYIAGRSDDCDLVLSDGIGISRQHFKLVQKNGSWTARSMSRFIPLIAAGEPSEIIELANGAIFSAPPFEFHFETDSAPMIRAIPVSEPSPEHDETLVTPRPDFSSLEPTQLAVLRKPCLKIRYLDREEVEFLQLEGSHWVAGRDSNSEIQIRDNRASRSHFEIIRMRENFFLIDLGAANGTTLNGQSVPENDPVPLESGAVIGISGVEFRFEVRDVSNNHIPMPIAHDQSLFPKPPRAPRPKRRRSAEARMLTIVFATAVLGFAFQLWRGRHAPRPDHAMDVANLSQDEKSMVTDIFAQAQSLYVHEKYDDCLAELKKLHVLVTRYEYSTDLESLCEQGRDLITKRDDVSRNNEKLEKMNKEVFAIIDKCKKQLTANSSLAETQTCLAPALAVNPGNPAISDFLRATEARIAEQAVVERKEHARRAREYICRTGLQRGQEYSEKDKLSQAIQAYESVMGNDCRNAAEAGREIASIKERLSLKISKFLKQCDDFEKKGSYKDAYRACERAVNEDPTNEVAKTRSTQMALELKHSIKSVYDDSVLDESMGNIDSAMAKWRQIVRDDLDFDEYAKKAKLQLEKYGAN